MKRSIMLLASILLCTGLAKANEEALAQPSLDESILGVLTLAQPNAGGKLITPADEQSTDDQMKTQANCYAWTICPNGRRISCYSRGDYCRWQRRDGRMVYCSATSNGRTRWYRSTCY